MLLVGKSLDRNVQSLHLLESEREYKERCAFTKSHVLVFSNRLQIDVESHMSRIIWLIVHRERVTDIAEIKRRTMEQIERTDIHLLRHRQKWRRVLFELVSFTRAVAYDTEKGNSDEWEHEFSDSYEVPPLLEDSDFENARENYYEPCHGKLADLAPASKGQ